MSFYYRPGCRANDLHHHHLPWLLCLIFSNSLIIPQCNLATKLSDRYAISARISLCLDDTVISQKRKMMFYDFFALLRQPRYARALFYDMARIATQSAICLHPDYVVQETHPGNILSFSSNSCRIEKPQLLPMKFMTCLVKPTQPARYVHRPTLQ